MSKIKYIFRDFWGTVAKLNLSQDSYAGQVAKLYKLPQDTIWASLAEPMSRFRRGEIQEADLRKAFTHNIGLPLHPGHARIFHRPVDEYALVYKSIIHFVQKLQSKGYLCVILSDDNKIQSKKSDQKGRYDIFDDKILSCDIGLSKFDDVTDGTSKIFDYVLKKFKIKPEEALFIDDGKKNCQVAESIGIKSVIAKGARQTIAETKRLLKI